MGSRLVLLGELLEVLTDYHANGAYKKLKENVELFDQPDYALMIRTTNFEQSSFDESSSKYISQNAYEFLSKSKVYPGDLIMNKIANAGSCYLMPDLNVPVSLAMNLFLLRVDKKKANPVYVYTYLKLNEDYVKSFANGSVTKTITKHAVRNLEVVLPSRENQEYIADIYSLFTRKIELNRQVNTTLASMAQALFKSWFVAFDPVIDNALAAGNPIPDELQAKAEVRSALGDQRKPLPESIRQQFPNRFVLTEEMGWVPEGWHASSVGEQVQTVGGGTPKTSEPSFWEGGSHAFCTPKDMSKLSSLVLMGTERRLTDAGVARVSSGLLPKGTVLMSSRAPIGYLAISDIAVAVNQGVIAMLPSAEYGPLYLLLWAQENMRNITDRANGSTFLEISKKNFRPIPFLVPTKNVLKYFNKQAEAIYQRILLTSEKSEALISTRDTLLPKLLPKLLSGELRIPDALAVVEKALV